MHSRNSTVDIAKGLGILLVVFGHNWIVLHDTGLLFRVIFSFHMPLFFFLSGIFLKESEPLPAFARARCQALIKPFWVVLAAVALISLVQHTSIAKQCLVAALYGTGSTMPSWPWVPLWFLPSLFVSLIASWLVLRLTDPLRHRRALRLVIAAVFLVSGAFTIDAFWNVDLARFGIPPLLFGRPIHLPGLPWNLDLLLTTSAFVLLGRLLRDEVLSARFEPVTWLAAATLFALLHAFYADTVNLDHRQFGNVPIALLKAAAGIYCILGASALLARSGRLARALAYLGSASLVILLFHLEVQERVFGFLTSLAWDHTAAAWFAFAAAVTVPVAIYALARRSVVISALLLPVRGGRRASA